MGYYDDENEGFYVEPPKQDEPKQEKKAESKKGKGVLKFIGKTVAAALIFCVVASAGFYGLNKAFNIIPEQQQTTETNGSTSTSVTPITNQSSTSISPVDDVSELVQNVMPSVVQVTNVSVSQYSGFFGQIFEQETPAAGSGFIIGKDDNYFYIATNNHVVTNSRDNTITFFDDASVSAEIQGTYQDKDVAVMRVKISDIPAETLSAIKVAAVGNSDNIVVGQGAIVIGNALGYGTSVSTGVVSALDREVSVKDQTGYVITNNLIQTDAAINQGNSGGPLLNMHGEVIGIVSVKYSAAVAEGMGYAIPISQAASIIEQLIANGSYSEAGDPSVASKAFLGIYGGMDIDQMTAQQYDMPMGVYVSSVVEGSAAEQAGISKGDVITAFEGEPIHAMSELQAAIAKLDPGTEVSVTFAIASNSYMEKTSRVVLQERPAE